jgi:hypothetical protein
MSRRGASGTPRHPHRAQDAGRCAEPRQPIETPLCGRDVHDGKARLTSGPEQASHPQRDFAEPYLQRDPVTNAHLEPARGGRTHEQHIGRQQVEAILDRGNQRRIDGTCAKSVDPDDAQRLPADRQLRVDFDHRARHAHFRQARESGVDRLVEAAAGPAYLEIGVPGKYLHTQRELADRRIID